MSRVLLAGGSGLVGTDVLARLLADARCSEVVALTRRAFADAHRKLREVVVDFDALSGDENVWQVDAVICALGSTMKQAGSRERFQRVDHAYPLAIARHARRHGARAYALNSAIGADAASRVFYTRTKGMLEDDLRAMDWPSLSIVRPGVIDGTRSESRPGEALMLMTTRVLSPVLPRQWRPSPVARIADALVEAALAPSPGVHVVEAAQLAD